MYLRTANGIVEYSGARPRALDPARKADLLAKAVRVAVDPGYIGEIHDVDRSHVNALAKAVRTGWTTASGGANSRNPKAVSSSAIAARAAANLEPSSSVTPPDIQRALDAQGLNWAAPFAPGTPLTPYYGYGRRPRQYDYTVGRNTTTETRQDRIPFATLLHLWKAYDIAQACTRYSINDLRSMRVRFTAMDGHDDNPVKEIAEAKRLLRKPDGKRFFRNWLAMNQRNLWIFDSAPIFRYRQGGKVTKLLNVSAMTIAPMLDYFGDFPEGDAPAFQQFIEGVPWDWLTWDDLIYEPFWPETDSPYGTPPLETILVNANTDLRLQTYFLDFFTKGTVPEAFAVAPEGMTDADALAELQEDWNDWTYGDQSERWGLRWLPAGTQITPYKPSQFDPDLAEYVERRSIAAFGLVPQNLGVLQDVNRATSDTQVDQQFRVSTLPVVGYYEDLLDAVIQDDWSLPVQIRFDTGREKEDRLTEAKAWYVAWQMGAVSSDEYRDKVMGLPIDLENPNPRTVDSQRLGPVPLSYPQEVSGPIDPLTFSPSKTPAYREYVVPGSQTADPVEAANGQDEAALPKPGAPKPGGANPKAKAPKGGPSAAGTAAASKERTADGPAPTEPALPAAGVAERDDLVRWRANARKAVARGGRPRRFTDTAIRAATADRVWALLEHARTRTDVDEAFAKAAGPRAAGLVVQAADTGRVLMVRRTPDKHDPKEAYARWEWPGGKLDDDDPWTGAVREFGEETGAALPDTFEHAGNWTSPDGAYTGFVVTVPSETDIVLDPDRNEVSQASWWDKTDLDDPEVRDKVTDTLDRVTPILKGWSGQPEWSMYHRHTDTIVDHYTPLIRQAMTHVLDPRIVHRAVTEAYEKHPDLAKAASWRDLLRLAQRTVQALKDVLARLYGDGYLQGAHDTAEASDGHMPPWTTAVDIPAGYWERWTPGTGDAASKAAHGALARLLRDADIWIREMTDTQVDRIGDAIADGIAKGFPVAEVTANIEAIVGDTERAYMIAETEFARALTAATNETMRVNGIELKQWLEQPDACPRCQTNHAVSPIPVNRPWPNGPVPVHPRCRCAEAPYIHLPGR